MQLAPVNPADLNLIEGTYGIKPPLPAICGNEGFGILFPFPLRSSTTKLPTICHSRQPQDSRSELSVYQFAYLTCF